MHALVDGRDFPFEITRTDFDVAMKGITGEFESPIGEKLADFWGILPSAKSLRIYLPNGEFRDTNTVGFDDAFRRVVQCLGQAAALNKAASR